MKKLHLLFALVIGLTIFSCSSEEPLENTNQGLNSITKVYYFRNNPNPYLTEKLNFDTNKLINIEYSDGSYDEIDYQGSLMSKISEFDENNDLEWTTNYIYDSSNRLITRKVVPGPNNILQDLPTRQKDITYDESTIQSILSWGDSESKRRSIISLNSENLMTEDHSYFSADVLYDSFIFNYSNENLSKVTNKDGDGNTFFEITYNYLDKEASDSYCYIKYLFGNEWKNNSSLNKQNGLGHVDSFEISKNYIKDYSYFNATHNLTRTVTFDYEFDAEDNILKQTRNENESNGDSFKTVTTYEYGQ